MRQLRAWVFVTVVAVALLVVFAVVEWLKVPLLTDPGPSLNTLSVAAACLGVGLLVVDAVLPVPSSAVMIALGATFGLVGGLVLSVAGSIGGFGLGFAIGRGSRQPVSATLLTADRHRAERLVERWGVLAVVMSRPVPLVAETVALTSGAFGMSAVPALAAALVGSVVPSGIYAYAGSRGASTADGAVIFFLVVAVAGALWVVGRRLGRERAV